MKLSPRRVAYLFVLAWLTSLLAAEYQGATLDAEAFRQNSILLIVLLTTLALGSYISKWRKEDRERD